MDRFEGIAKTLLEADGYWVSQSYKVALSKQDRKDLGKPSMPRVEIDLLAYNPVLNELQVVEVKSYLDSYGVRKRDFEREFEVPTGPYKLFTCSAYREMVWAQLRRQLEGTCEDEQALRPMILKDTPIKLKMVAANVYGRDEKGLEQFFLDRGWEFWGPTVVCDRVRSLADRGYENDPAIITAKILSKGVKNG